MDNSYDVIFFSSPTSAKLIISYKKQYYTKTEILKSTIKEKSYPFYLNTPT